MELDKSCQSLAQLLVDNDTHPAPSRIDLLTPHTMVTVGIGKNHVATLIISDDALDELTDMMLARRVTPCR